MKLWAISRVDRIDDYLDSIVNDDSSLGFSEERFFFEFLLPALDEKVSVQYNSKICSLETLPENNMVLSGCGNMKSNQKTIEKLTDRWCESGKGRICKLRPHKLTPLEMSRDTAVVCSIMTKEEAYLDEWIDYHLGIGFEHMYIYDNTADLELGHGWLDHRLWLSERVMVATFPGHSMQVLAFQDCRRKYALGNGHQWVTHFDADEFLILWNHSNVVDFLRDYCKDGAVSLNWQVMTWDNELQYRPQPLTKRFQGVLNYSDVINHHVKTISNARHVSLVSNDHHPHYPILKCGYH